MEKEQNPTRQLIKMVVLVLAIGTVAAFIFGTFAVVPAGHRGVLLTYGKVESRILSEGISTVTPFVNQVVIMPVQTMKYTAQASSASSDLQIVTTEVTLNYHLDAGNVNKIYQQFYFTWEDRVIVPAIQEAVKASTAEFGATDLIQKRAVVKDAIESSLKDKLSGYNVIVENVYITDFKFSPEFETAIENKVVAEQNAQQAENVLKQKKIEAEQMIATADGLAQSKILTATAEAKALQIQAEALKQSKEILQLRWIEKWNGLLPQYLLSSTATDGMILNLPQTTGN
jgi:regulator of protease activity HflC (stomatin/prohibitin superfamily)